MIFASQGYYTFLPPIYITASDWCQGVISCAMDTEIGLIKNAGLDGQCCYLLQ